MSVLKALKRLGFKLLKPRRFKALENHLIFQIKVILVNVAAFKQIKLVWTPAHVGVTGNEYADYLVELTNTLGGNTQNMPCV